MDALESVTVCVLGDEDDGHVPGALRRAHPLRIATPDALRPEDAAIDWYVLKDGRYEAMAGEEGVLKSGVFPGLWLDAGAMLKGDLGRVIAVVEAGVGTPGHGEFAGQLK